MPSTKALGPRRCAPASPSSASSQESGPRRILPPPYRNKYATGKSSSTPPGSRSSEPIASVLLVAALIAEGLLRQPSRAIIVKEVRIMGSKSVLLRTLVAASSAKTARFGVLYRSGAPEEIRTLGPRFVRSGSKNLLRLDVSRTCAAKCPHEHFRSAETHRLADRWREVCGQPAPDDGGNRRAHGAGGLAGGAGGGVSSCRRRPH